MSVWTSPSLVVGHRGGRGDGWPPENTLAAFEHARAQGARAVELDARTSADGEVVVAHDPTREPLAALSARGIPTLAEALAWARDHGVAVNVELKHDGVDRPRLVRLALKAVKASRADVLVSSFDPLLLAMCATLAPRLPRALLVHARQRAWADAVQATSRPPLVSALHLERTQTEPRVVAAALQRGLRVGVWTVNDPREAADLVRLGVATIISDHPGDILDALTRR